eukprot:scaffold308741_cov13-Tisochrysis_lutea.AAC.1
MDPNAVDGDYNAKQASGRQPPRRAASPDPPPLLLNRPLPFRLGQTDWMQSSFPKERVNMPVPIVLPVTDFTRREIKKASAVALTNAAGVPLAILRDPE